MEQQGYFTEQGIYNFTGKHTVNPIFNGQWSAALYYRFSKDDGDVEDSTSIETQDLLGKRFCKNNGFPIYDTYKDDGYTGLNFNRPDFQRLLGDIESGKVNLVITKDQSRLGRDYIMTGYFTEIYFADRNVRYIAIDDGADTARPESSDFMPFRNVINNMQSKEIEWNYRRPKTTQKSYGMTCFWIGRNTCKME